MGLIMNIGLFLLCAAASFIIVTVYNKIKRKVTIFTDMETIAIIELMADAMYEKNATKPFLYKHTRKDGVLFSSTFPNSYRAIIYHPSSMNKRDFKIALYSTYNNKLTNEQFIAGLFVEYKAEATKAITSVMGYQPFNIDGESNDEHK